MSTLRLVKPMLPRRCALFCVVIAITWSLCLISGVDACPPGCTCTTLKPKDGKSGETPRIGRGRKVNCAENLSPITSVDQINSLPLDTVILDLSKNAITILRRYSFNRLSMLRKLDLSNNQISLIESGAFDGLQNLEKLDLSYNNIGSVNSSMFTGMPTLQRMSLSFNKFNTIPEGTFSHLISLRKIEFKSNYLRCDCHLRWIAKWTKEKNIRIQSSTTCAVPQELKDRPLKGLKKKELHCDRPLELPLFEITPSKSQVVFEGDKIPFECRASVVDENTDMFWVRKGDIVSTNRSAGIFVHTYPSADKTMLTHRLVIQGLTKEDTGVWQCIVITPQGNVSDDISIVVISNEAASCVAVTSKTEKGIYKWPKTVAGVRSELPCKRGVDKLATHDCTAEGRWRDLNVDQCEFTSDTTRKLKSIGDNLSDKLLGNTSALMKTTRDLNQLVSRPNQMTYSTDLTLVSRVLERIMPYSHLREEILDMVLKIISNLLKLPVSMFLSEQKAAQSCTRLVNVVETIPDQQLMLRPSVTMISESIVIEARTVPVSQFTGMTCHAFTSIFSCVVGINISSTFIKKQSNLHGSIHLPQSLLNNSAEDQLPDNINLQFILYKESKLFPVTTSIHDDVTLGLSKVTILSSVLSVNVSTPVTNLSEPVILYFKIQRPSKHLVAAYWDFEANGGNGDWRTDGCQIVPDPSNITVVHCFHLSIFAILEVNDSNGLNRDGMMTGTLHLLPYPVYVGSCICLLCLMAVIITYVSCFRFINVPKKMKHSVINICVSILLLLIGFTMGVKRTDHHLACQIVGVAIHYLTLVAMFWITVTSYNMLKKFNKVNKPPSPPPEPVAMPLPPKPMLRFYLLAWGVPLIVCGITVAVSIDHYSEPNYCFLSWDPSIGAFYSPTGLLVVFNLIFFLRISRVIHKTTNNLNETDNTEEVNDIELTQSPDDTNTEIQALTNTHRQPEDDTESIASSVMDQERQPITQLYAVVAMLFLYILFYTCAGFAVAQPFKSIIPHQELIFSYLYGLTSSAFGIFMLVYFCLTRKDSCSSWRRFFFCDQHPVYDVNYRGTNHMSLSNGHVIHANSDLDVDNKNYNITQDVTDGSVKQSNINLIPAPGFLTDSSVTGPADANNMMPNFYNPKQNGIAKKFWDRQRHHSKLITKEMTKDFNGSGTDYFSGSEANHRCGNTSDVNTHLSIEIQIQPTGMQNGVARPPSSSPNNITNAQQCLYPTQLLLPAIQGSNGPIPKFSMLPLDRNIIPPVGGSVSPVIVTTSPCCSTVSYSGSQVVPAHGRSPSACSLGVRPHPSAFTPVPPRNNTLPKQGKNPVQSNNTTSTSPTQDYMVRNGSVPRLRDFDGQSQISDACPREKQWGMQVANNYLNNNHQNSNHSTPGYDPLSRLSPQQQQQQQQQRCTYKQYGSVDEHITSDRPPPSYHFSRARSSSGGYSSDTSGRLQRKREQAFLQEVHQRIPCDNNKMSMQEQIRTQSPRPLSPNNKSPVTLESQVCNNTNGKIFTTHDSDSQLHLRRNRGNDSDHNSEPTSQASHRRRHRSHDPQHRHSKHHKQSAKKQHSSSTEWEGTPRPKMIPYAYVNYHYHDRVKQKLQQKNVPESPAYPHLMEDSSSSSDSEGLDDIWVMQHKKQKNKKETSV